YCVDLDIDLVNLSLGSPQQSEAIEQKLEEAALHGVACIVAAGNSGGRVQFPGSSRYTLAVSAVGCLNEFPEASWDATTVLPNLVASDGIFSPAFIAFGPDVAVGAPAGAPLSPAPRVFAPHQGCSTVGHLLTGHPAPLVLPFPPFLRPRPPRRP